MAEAVVLGRFEHGTVGEALRTLELCRSHLHHVRADRIVAAAAQLSADDCAPWLAGEGRARGIVDVVATLLATGKPDRTAPAR